VPAAGSCLCATGSASSRYFTLRRRTRFDIAGIGSQAVAWTLRSLLMINAHGG